MKKYIEALKGISYFEWIRLREGIDSDFEQQIDESKKSLQLTDPENVERAICSMYLMVLKTEELLQNLWIKMVSQDYGKVNRDART